MKKIIALMLALIMCFAMLVSCDDDEESSSEPSSESQQEQGELPSESLDGDNPVEFN